MLLFGDVHPDIQKLSKVAREAMFEGIAVCKPGAKFFEIGEAIEDYAEKFGYCVNPFFRGHGIGECLHMAPPVNHDKMNLGHNQR